MKPNKILSMFFALITCTTIFTACKEKEPDAKPHTHDVCVYCGLCTIEDCDGEVAEKCAGHEAIARYTNEIIFNVDNDVFYSVKAETIASAQLPSPPHKKGYTFAGWYSDIECEGYKVDNLAEDIIYRQIATASMTPTLQIGDIVRYEPQATYSVNDIVGYYNSTGEYTFTHRIIEVLDNNQYVTKGDASQIANDPIDGSKIFGKVVQIFTSGSPIKVNLYAKWTVNA